MNCGVNPIKRLKSEDFEKKILITGGWNRASLALINSLPKNLYVIIGSASKWSMTGFSKKINERFIYPDPELYPIAFVDAITNFLEVNQVNILAPCLEEGFYLSENIERLEKTGAKIKFPQYELIRLLSDKFDFYDWCRKNHFPVADGAYVKSFDQLKTLCRKERSILRLRESNGGKGVFLSDAVTKKALQAMRTSLDNNGSVLRQEFIAGYGLTVEGIWAGGAVDGLVVRKTHRFKLPIGGAAAVIESTYHKEAICVAKSLMAKLDYRGPAQVELRIDLNGKPVLIEVNPRWWGTIMFNTKTSSAYGSYLADIEAEDEGSEEGVPNGLLGVWWLGLLISIFTYKGKGVFRIFKLLIEKAKGGEVIALDYVKGDPRPFLMEFLSYAVELFGSVKNKKSRIIKIRNEQ